MSLCIDVRVGAIANTFGILLDPPLR